MCAVLRVLQKSNNAPKSGANPTPTSFLVSYTSYSTVIEMNQHQEEPSGSGTCTSTMGAVRKPPTICVSIVVVP